MQSVCQEDTSCTASPVEKEDGFHGMFHPQIQQLHTLDQVKFWPTSICVSESDWDWSFEYLGPHLFASDVSASEAAYPLEKERPQLRAQLLELSH